MSTISKQRLSIAIGFPALIFISSFLVTFSSKFKQHYDVLSIGLLVDMLLVAPLIYLLIIRKTEVSKLTVLRVFTVGLLIVTYLLSQKQTALLDFIKIWIAPLVEITIFISIFWKFYKAKQLYKTKQPTHFDFLIFSRNLFSEVLSSQKAGNVMATEIAVFYYLFYRKSKKNQDNTHFTSHKENGIVLVLSTFLFMILLEAVVMHFVFALWNTTAAWILSGLSVYTCLQLLAHIKSIYARPTLIIGNEIMFRNGLMGGDVTINIDNIERIEESTKEISEPELVNMAFIKIIENHNIILHLKQSVQVSKAYGIKKTAKVILIHIDEPKMFINHIHLLHHSIKTQL
jgi:hypothetical protein